MRRPCGEALDLLDARRRAPLEPSGEARLNAHLQGCSACREAAGNQAFADRAMEAWPERTYAPPPLPEVIPEVVQEPVGAGAGWRPIAAYGLGLAAVAAVVAVIAFLARGDERRAPDVPEPPAPVVVVQELPTTEPVALRDGDAHSAPAPEAPAETAVAEPAPETLAGAPEPPKPRRPRPRWPRRPVSMVSQPAPAPEAPVEEAPDTKKGDANGSEAEPDLSEFFALGPPLPPHPEPQVVVETSEVLSADGSVMTVESYTDLTTGERAARVVAVYEPALATVNSTAPDSEAGDEGPPDDAASPHGTDRSGHRQRGGEFG